MNVLSLFDGMSCGQIALNRLGFDIQNYFASEIEQSSMNVTLKNFPNTKQIGDVMKINGYDLPKIDLLIGGSPCQSFTFAGKRVGMVTKDKIEITSLKQYLELKSNGFEFEGEFSAIEPLKYIKYRILDDRIVEVKFTQKAKFVTVEVIFDAETENSVELQKQGWQQILNSFKQYVLTQN